MRPSKVPRNRVSHHNFLVGTDRKNRRPIRAMLCGSARRSHRASRPPRPMRPSSAPAPSPARGRQDGRDWSSPVSFLPLPPPCAARSPLASRRRGHRASTAGFLPIARKFSAGGAAVAGACIAADD
jgi:hypothetical protein